MGEVSCVVMLMFDMIAGLLALQKDLSAIGVAGNTSI